MDITGINFVGVLLICPESHIWMFLRNREQDAWDSLIKLRGDIRAADSEMKQIRENQKNVDGNQNFDELSSKNLLQKCM